MCLTVGSLFSGIGGIELGLERCGMKTLWQVEQDPYCLAVLKKQWPDVERFTDVRTAGAHNLRPVDVVCGGFPCQDISLAGKGAGLDGERSGLWYEYARIVRELRPRFVLVENVAALTNRGLDRVLWTLAALGYDAEWDCIPASYVGAPHRRDRVWIVAHTNGESPQPIRTARQVVSARRADQGKGSERERIRNAVDGCCENPNGSSLELSNSNDPRLEGRICQVLRQRASELPSGALGSHEPPLHSWPTPQFRDFRSGEGHRWLSPEKRSANLNDAVAAANGYKMTPESEPSKGGGALNPTWVEWLMGFPLGWTGLNASETPLSRKRRKKEVVES